MHAALRPRVFRKLIDILPVVYTSHLFPCPNGNHYWWEERQACDRQPSLGCLTVGYRSKGCGHLGNGQPYGLPGFVRGMAMDRHLRESIRRCHRVISPSAWLGDYLTQNGVAKGRMEIIHPPLAPSSFVVATERVNPPRVTYVGRLVETKGVDQLLFSSALLDVPHTISIVGDGPARKSLARLAESLGIAHRVRFHGRMSASQVEAERLASAVTVVPSVSPEVFGMVGPESLSNGVPVVASLIGGIPEWLALGGGLAIGVPPANPGGLAEALIKMLRNPPTLAERTRVAARVRNVLGSDGHARRLVACYGSAAGECARSGRMSLR